MIPKSYDILFNQLDNLKKNRLHIDETKNYLNKLSIMFKKNENKSNRLSKSISNLFNFSNLNSSVHQNNCNTIIDNILADNFIDQEENKLVKDILGDFYSIPKSIGSLKKVLYESCNSKFGFINILFNNEQKEILLDLVKHSLEKKMNEKINIKQIKINIEKECSEIIVLINNLNKKTNFLCKDSEKFKLFFNSGNFLNYYVNKNKIEFLSIESTLKSIENLFIDIIDRSSFIKKKYLDLAKIYPNHLEFYLNIYYPIFQSMIKEKNYNVKDLFNRVNALLYEKKALMLSSISLDNLTNEKNEGVKDQILFYIKIFMDQYLLKILIILIFLMLSLLIIEES